MNSEMQENKFYYRSYTDFLKQKFGTRVQKLSVHAGLTCPNRDGSKGTGGCIYCLNEAFTPSYCKSEKSIGQQLREGIEFHRNRYRRATSYIAYFQSFTNTYSDTVHLKAMFEEAMNEENIAGITIGTRPDCINHEIAGLLSRFSEKIFVKVELGIESVFDDTLLYIRRGHTMKDTLHALQILKEFKIPAGGHLILGLPGEDKSHIMKTASIVSDLGLFSVKLHQLQIFKETELEKIFLESQKHIPLFELNEYIDIVIDFTELLNPEIYIERFAGEVPPKYLVAPDWGMIRYDQILQKIQKRFVERDTFQGRLY
jgi:uncharacterized protein